MSNNRYIVSIIGLVATLLITVVSAWISINQRVKALEVGTDIRLKNLEVQVQQNKNYYHEILNEIKYLNVQLERKEDRR